jgi:hypothetical protein
MRITRGSSHGRLSLFFRRSKLPTVPSPTTKRETGRDTVEFGSLPVQFTDDSTKETVDEKMVIELLGQLLLTASQSHRNFLEQQEEHVRELMQRIRENPRQVEAELAKVYQQIKASFTRLAEAIGDHHAG